MANNKERVRKEDGTYQCMFDISVGEKVIELSNQGYSLEAIAGELGVTRKTIYTWRQKYPEFAHLCEVAQGKRLFAWEKKIIDAESGPAVQAATLALRGSGLNIWQDRKQLDVVVETQNKLSLDKMSPEDIKKLMQIVQTQQLAIENQIEDADYEEVGE